MVHFMHSIIHSYINKILRRLREMNSHNFDKLTVYVLALLVFVIFSGELSAMLAIASHECQGVSCSESVNSER